MTRPAETDPATSSTAIRGCLEACRRCQLLVDRVTGSSSAERAYAAIGPHLRHCLDHFNCLLRGLDSGRVDYDARERDAKLERDPETFRSALASIVERLSTLDAASSPHVLQVRQAAASGGDSVEVPTSLERELVFLSGHTIHHLAIMKILAQTYGVLVPGKLDYAFSTEAYLESARDL